MKNVHVFTMAVIALAASAAPLAASTHYQVKSPDGHIAVEITAEHGLHFAVNRDGAPVIEKVDIGLAVDDEAVPGDSVPQKAAPASHSAEIKAPVAIKNAIIKDDYQELKLEYAEKFSIVFRAYNDAVAYQFVTGRPGTIAVQAEKCDITFPKAATAWFSIAKSFVNDYQHIYDIAPVNALGKKRSQLPVLVQIPSQGKVLITESGLRDYPGMYLTGSQESDLAAVQPPAVKTEKTNKKGEKRWDRVFNPDETYPYIAKTSGTRSFPWRIFALAEKDTQLLNNEIVYKLAEPSAIQDSSWIKPGLVSWDWWNALNITGVDFKSGPNTDTYKYYIDFAARHGIPYVILDEGWYELGDIMKQVPDIDVPALAAYGKEKGVDLILWTVWRTLDDKMEEALAQFEQWGIKGIKVDFMNRDDQDVVNFYWRCAETAAKHHLMVDFHGAHKPAGLQRTYPNVMTFEGFPGQEEVKWSDKTTTPGMTNSLPYIRMFTGPLDYTPGAMRNAQQKDFKAIFNAPMSMGTRCMQFAEYVIFESPLQMLCDTPDNYEKEKESLDFIVKIPTTWDETFPLAGEVGKFTTLARRHGSGDKAEYFAAAMTDWDARDLTIDLSFLPEGDWQAEIMQDGINADRNATDYKRVEKTVRGGDKLNIHMAPGGGWAARFTRK